MPPQRLPGWFAAASAVVAIAVYGLLVVAAARADDTVLTLDGPGATRLGHQVTFAGQLEPARSGVRVGVYLGSSVVGWANTGSDGVFVVRPDLFVTGDYRARAQGVVSAPRHIRVVRPLLGQGAHSSGVRVLATRLAELGYAVNSTATNVFTGALQQSVFAFQKAQGLTVDGVVGPATRASLESPVSPVPRHAEPAMHIEVDKERQLVLLVEGGRVRTIINTSTAGIPGYHTPEGTFRIFRRVAGIDTSPLGALYDPLYFDRGYAIHGSTSVPPRPASHGCVRIPIWESARLFDTVPHGTTVYVY